jgi:hypothetical protein
MIHGEISQQLGVKIANEPVTSIAIIRNHVYILSSGGALDITGNLGTLSYTTGQATSASPSGRMYNPLNWVETMDDPPTQKTPPPP